MQFGLTLGARVVGATIAVAALTAVMGAGVASARPTSTLNSTVIEAPTPAPTAAPGPTAPPQLGLIAIGEPLGYFDVTVAAGKSRTLKVQLTNPGAATATARTYRADAYTLLNGGFGSRTGADAVTGATMWVDYPGGPVTLKVAQSLEQTFTVTVPANTPPGEYISSIVAESGELTGTGIGGNQIVRTAVAVSIRVPGDLHPAIAVGRASQQQDGTKTTVEVALENTGNERLKPLVQLTVKDSGDNELSARTVAMGSFFSATSTSVDTALPGALPAGRYTVTVAVRDPTSELPDIRVIRHFTVPGEISVHPAKAPAAAPKISPVGLALIAGALAIIGGLLFCAIRFRARAR